MDGLEKQVYAQVCDGLSAAISERLNRGYADNPLNKMIDSVVSSREASIRKLLEEAVDGALVGDFRTAMREAVTHKLAKLLASKCERTARFPSVSCASGDGNRTGRERHNERRRGMTDKHMAEQLAQLAGWFKDGLGAYMEVSMNDGATWGRHPLHGNIIVPEFTYRLAAQETLCDVCGKLKHTPLRNDTMGGYVCLTCIDREMIRLQSAGAIIGQHTSALLDSVCSAQPDPGEGYRMLRCRTKTQPGEITKSGDEYRHPSSLNWLPDMWTGIEVLEYKTSPGGFNLRRRKVKTVVRPYTDAELADKCKAGTVLVDKFNPARKTMVTDIEENKCIVILAGEWRTADDVCRGFTHEDGTPCGVTETVDA